jgi:hypothetical protein
MRIFSTFLFIALCASQVARPLESRQIGVIFLNQGISEFHMGRAKAKILKQLNEGSSDGFSELILSTLPEISPYRKEFSEAEEHLKKSLALLTAANFEQAQNEADKGLAIVGDAGLFYDCVDLRIKLRVSRIQAILGLEKGVSLKADLQDLVNDKPDFQFDEKTFSPKELAQIKKDLSDIIAPKNSLLVKTPVDQVEIIVDGKKIGMAISREGLRIPNLGRKKVHVSAVKSGFLPIREEIVIDGLETVVALDLQKITLPNLLQPRFDRALEETLFFSNLAGNRVGLVFISIERVGDSSVNFHGQFFKTGTATFSPDMGVNYKKSFLLLDAICSHFARELKGKFL